MMRQAHYTDIQNRSMRRPNAPHQHEPAEIKSQAPSSQDLLRRLKRGYLLQYECDEEDDQDGVRSVARSTKCFAMLKREVMLSQSNDYFECDYVLETFRRFTPRHE